MRAPPVRTSPRVLNPSWWVRLLSARRGPQLTPIIVREARRGAGHMRCKKAAIPVGVLVDRSPSSDARFRRLFEEHQAVLSYCHRRLPADDADDAAAEVFTIVWSRLAKVPAEPATLPWLYGVVCRTLAAMADC